MLVSFSAFEKWARAQVERTESIPALRTHMIKNDSWVMALQPNPCVGVSQETAIAQPVGMATIANDRPIPNHANGRWCRRPSAEFTKSMNFSACQTGRPPQLHLSYIWDEISGKVAASDFSRGAKAVSGLGTPGGSVGRAWDFSKSFRKSSKTRGTKCEV